MPLLRATLLGLALIGALNGATDRQWNRIAEENAVIVAVIDSIYHSQSPLVLNDSTSQFWARENYNPGDKFRAAIAAKGDSSTLADFYAVNREPRHLNGIKPGYVVFQVVSDSVFHRFTGGSVESYWTAFYARFPGTHGRMRAARPGFNADHTMAIAEIDNGCGGRCGYGGVFVLRKINGVWHITETLEAMTS